MVQYPSFLSVLTVISRLIPFRFRSSPDETFPMYARRTPPGRIFDYWIVASTVTAALSLGVWLLIPSSKNDPESDLAFVSRCLSKSHAFVAFRQRLARPSYFIDGRGDGYLVVAYGENLDTHFIRSGTLRVYWSGKVMRNADKTYLDSRWVIDNPWRTLRELFLPPPSPRPDLPPGTATSPIPVCLP